MIVVNRNPSWCDAIVQRRAIGQHINNPSRPADDQSNRGHRQHSIRCVLIAVVALTLAAVAPVHGTTYSQIHKLTASDGRATDEFGISVAATRTMAVVGALFDDDNGSQSGSAYVFDVTTGNELFKLTASDGAAGDLFGWSVAASGNTAVVGDPNDDDNGTNSGSAYVFDLTTGNELFKLTPVDNPGGDRFGRSVAASGNIAVIGAPLDDDNGRLSGSAYVFDVTTGNELFKLTASDGAAGDRFGTAVAVSGNTAVIGVPNDQDSGTNSGSAYVFDLTTGNELFKLTASDADVGDQFGISAAVSGKLITVGAWTYGNSGSAYVFNLTTGNELLKINASDRAAFDYFGNAMAVSGNRAVVGAYSDDDNGRDSGSVYVFAIIPLPAAFPLGLAALLAMARRPPVQS